MPAPSTLALFALAALALIAIPGFLMDCLYAIVSAAAAGRLRGTASGGKVTGTVYLVLGAAAALTGGRH